jgi:hypothetical protein
MRRFQSILFLLAGASAAGCSAVETQENYIVPPKGRGFLNPSTVYATNPNAPGYGHLVQIVQESDGSDSSAGIRIRRSADNGATWSVLTYIERYRQIGNDRLKYGPASLFADPDNGLMVLFAQEAYYEDNRIDSTWKKRRIVYRISADNGLTWSDHIKLIQAGADRAGRPFDETYWMEGAVYGRNMSTTIGGMAIKIRGDGPNRGKILLPFQIQQVDANGALLMPVWGGYMASGCLIGAWEEDLCDLTWGCSNQVIVPHTESSRGVFEPSVAELPDGRVVMVMRGSNAGLNGVKGVKFVSISDDQGKTFSSPTPLLFDDGAPMLSSSSMSLLVRGSDGRVWYCGVITDQEPQGNAPRYPVCLAEIDPVTVAVRRDTVVVVADRRPGDPPGVQYVNHWVYEDPARNGFVVLTPHLITMDVDTAVDWHFVPMP